MTFDPAKRDKTLLERGLDFADAAFVFEGDILEVEDIRHDCGEARIICYGLLAGWAGGGCGLHHAWRGSPRLQYEESK